MYRILKIVKNHFSAPTLLVQQYYIYYCSQKRNKFPVRDYLTNFDLCKVPNSEMRSDFSELKFVWNSNFSPKNSCCLIKHGIKYLDRLELLKKKMRSFTWYSVWKIIYSKKSLIFRESFNFSIFELMIIFYNAAELFSYASYKWIKFNWKSKKFYRIIVVTKHF